MKVKKCSVENLVAELCSPNIPNKVLGIPGQVKNSFLRPSPDVFYFAGDQKKRMCKDEMTDIAEVIVYVATGEAERIRKVLRVSTADSLASLGESDGCTLGN